tara:strand:+ start:1863 stop:2621 length:759 start_codon:yes stop_codon:yes gene_type:complete
MIIKKNFKMLKIDNHQNDFTEKNYKRLLYKIKNKTIFFHEIDTINKFTLWRHDVDLSVHRAYALAKIEKSLNIRATYFLLFGSNFYNIFDKEIKNLIYKIKSLGHQFGLHFDSTQYNINKKKDLEKYLSFEKNILEDLFQIKIKTFSYHNPSEKILSYDNFKYAKMINAYAKYFKKNVKYCSDSDGYWRHKRLESFLDENHDKIQVLTHPGWWQKRVMAPFSRVKRCLNGREQATNNEYRNTFKKLKRKIIY